VSKLIILDRDGVINYDSDAFIKNPDEWIPIPGSPEAIARLSQAGFTVTIASNQSGIARGLLDEATLERIHAKLLKVIEEAGGRISLLVYCPHGPNDGCDCRKPLPGLYRRIGEALGEDLTGVPVIGDSLRDLQAAEAVGGSPMLVLTGKGEKSRRQLGTSSTIPIFPDLAAAVDALLHRGGSNP